MESIKNTMFRANHLPVLHALRAIAALMVLATHFMTAAYLSEVNTGTVDMQGFAYQFFYRAGAFGVDLFFYLSGFLMIYTTSQNANHTACGFLVKRVFRIFPAYWLSLACYLVLVKMDANSFEILEAALLIPRQNTSPPFLGLSLLPVAWTLTYEMLFYVVFALGLKFKISVLTHGPLIALSIVSLGFGLQWMWVGQITLDPYAAPLAPGSDISSRLLSALSNPMMLLFTIGMLGGMIYVRLEKCSQHLPSRQLNALALALFASAPFFYWALPANHGFMGIATPAMMVFVAGMLSDLIGSPFRMSVLSILGNYSYGIYLIHQPIIELVSLLLPNFWMDHPGWTGLLTLCVLVFPVSAALFHYIEQPCISLGKKVSKQCTNGKQFS